MKHIKGNGWSFQSNNSLLVVLLMALSFASALAAGDGESSAVAAMAGASVLKMGRFQVGGAKLPWFLATVPLLSMQSL